MSRRLYLFDTTLRDGAQTHGIDFSVEDKVATMLDLDEFGFDYIEAGFPGANVTDTVLFRDLPRMNRALVTAFGKTRRKGQEGIDPSLEPIIKDERCHAVCLVGKTWDFHVTVALQVSQEVNLEMIATSIQALKDKKEVLFDAEHFFDGYKNNRDYALRCLRTAYEAGARWIVLCDTNGGSLWDEIGEITQDVCRMIPPENIGIHTHNDTGNAVANSIAAVQNGAHMIQGTLNGLGERCGNANLVTLIPTLVAKLGYQTGIERLDRLVALSRAIDDRVNRVSDPYAPYVGASAFAHKGGLHASAVEKDPACYEHIAPERVGNGRVILISDQSGQANVLSRLKKMGISVKGKSSEVSALVDLIKERDYQGYAYDRAEASFEILVRQRLEQIPTYFTVMRFSARDERRYNALGRLVTESEATLKIRIGSSEIHTVADGNGPVNALDKALRKALRPFYPSIETMGLTDYSVRILNGHDNTRAATRVSIKSNDTNGRFWNTIGVSTNIIEASVEALTDSLIFKFFHENLEPHDG